MHSPIAWERGPLLAFFGITFAITWSLGGMILLFGEPLVGIFGELDLRRPFWKLVFHVATYAPAIAAVTVVGARHGREGLKRFGRRLRRWRVALFWWGVVLVGFPALQLAARVIANQLETPVPFIEPGLGFGVLGLFLIAIFDDPGAVEEIGWRGFALPILQQRFGALAASSILGLIWGVWHLPAFYIAATSQSGFSFPVFLIGSVGLSILMTIVFNGSGGCVLLVFLIHAIGNFDFGVEGASTTVEMATRTLLGLAVAIPVVWRLGARNLGPERVTTYLDGRVGH